jgi:hypothetical protein
MANDEGAPKPVDHGTRGGVTVIHKGGVVASGNPADPLPAAPASGSAVVSSILATTAPVPTPSSSASEE